MMRATIKKGIANGIINAQPSKSFSHRLLIASALSKNESVVNNVVFSNDIIATINCLKALGKDIITIDKKVIIKEKKDFVLSDELVFDCLESGSTLRFFIPIAATTGKRLVFKGTEKLISRGIGPYQEIFEKQNINVEVLKDEIIIEGKLDSGDFNLVGNISSQFITGLLFALPLLKKDSTINITTNLESKNYINMTLDVLKLSNIKIDCFDNKFGVYGNQKYSGGIFTVEGDYSNAAFLDSLNFLNGNIVINGLNPDSSQGDKVYLEIFKKISNEYCTIDISNCIDLGPILFAFSSLKHGAHFINTKRLKIKESNRVLDLKEELEKFGIIVKDLDNEVYIDNSLLHSPNVELNGRNDHRIVMALSIMLTIFGGSIEGIEAVNKSYPDFFKDLERLGIEVSYE